MIALANPAARSTATPGWRAAASPGKAQRSRWPCGRFQNFNMWDASRSPDSNNCRSRGTREMLRRRKGPSIHRCNRRTSVPLDLDSHRVEFLQESRKNHDPRNNTGPESSRSPFRNDCKSLPPKGLDFLRAPESERLENRRLPQMQGRRQPGRLHPRPAPLKPRRSYAESSSSLACTHVVGVSYPATLIDKAQPAVASRHAHVSTAVRRFGLDSNIRLSTVPIDRHHLLAPEGIKALIQQAEAQNRVVRSNFLRVATNGSAGFRTVVHAHAERTNAG